MKLNKSTVSAMVAFSEKVKASAFSMKAAKEWADETKQDASFLSALRKFAVKGERGQFHLDYDGDGNFRSIQKASAVADEYEAAEAARHALKVERERSKQVREELKALREEKRKEREAKREALLAKRKEREEKAEERQKLRAERIASQLRKMEERRLKAEVQIAQLKEARAEREAKRKAK